MLEEITSVMNDEEYHERYDICLKNGLSLRPAKSVAYMNEVFHNLCIDTDRELRVLAIGTGNGIADIPIINAIIRRYSKIVYEFVEPFQSKVDEFKALVGSRDDWKEVTFNSYTQTIDDFIRDKKKEGQGIHYDVIHAIHCVYYFDGGHTIRTLYDWVAKDGIFLIGIASGGWVDCTIKINQIYRNPKRRFVGCESVLDCLKEFPGIKMEKDARECQIKVTECFQPHSVDGNKMLDVLYGILNFRKYVGQERATMLLDYLKEICIQKGDGYFLVGFDNDIVIKK
ncbi:histamine N-methyltransferase-like [Glandiceps talaboti]